MWAIFLQKVRALASDFVFYENKGAIAFAASRGFGFIYALKNFAVEYYNLAGDSFYGASIGELMKKSIQSFDHREDIATKILMEQTVLQGDPALKLHPRPGPDYVVDQKSVRLEPPVINLRQDSFKVSFDVLNIGTFIRDSMQLEVVQQLPDGSKLTLKKTTIASPANIAQMTFRLPTLGKASVGLNRLYIQLDTEGNIEELPAPEAEFNNHLIGFDGDEGIAFYVLDNGAIPVYPPNFGIAGTPNVILKASTNNALAAEATYIVQIDTTESFNSPLLQKKEIVQKGGLIKWQPNLNLMDGKVYYWRISPDSLSADVGFSWENSSFTYLEGSEEGWRQGHYWQFLKNEMEGMVLNEEKRDFQFEAKDVNIRIRNKIFDAVDRPGLHYDFGHPAPSVSPWDYLESGLAVVVSRPETASFWRNATSNPDISFNPGDYGLATANSRVFVFPTNTTAQRANLLEFLEEIIPNDYYVFVWTVLQFENANFHPEQWAGDVDSLGRSLYDYFESEGASSIRLLEERGAVPYILMYQKSNGMLQEKMAAQKYEQIIVEDFFPQIATEGKVQSVLIGPAQQWQTLSWMYERQANDSVSVSVIGLDRNNSEIPLISNLMQRDTSLRFIDATQYPFLKLEYKAKDETDRTAGQLNHWQIHYQGLPDIAIAAVNFPTDTLQQGEALKVEATLENVGRLSIDSTDFSYAFFDKNNNQSSYHFKIASLEAEEVLKLNFEIETARLKELYRFIMTINEAENPEERHYFNNRALAQFFVEQDKRNPILDVTFDGRRIMSGDIVSPSTMISITLEDENEYLALADTSLLDILLEYPNGDQKSIDFNQPNSLFYPADLGQNNRAKVEWSPNFEQDGIYSLKVQGRDVAGNHSGELMYEVAFEVIQEEMVSNVLNYPNPFSSLTRFVYTLTGNELPEVFTIRIMTVNGRIVREIDKSELGELKIGTHQTDFAWDGTDEFGDKLANGVYLYQVIVKDTNGNDYKKYDNGTSPFFKKNIGKLVLIR